MKKALIIRLSSAGDILITAGVIAGLKKSGYITHLVCKEKFIQAGKAVLPGRVIAYREGADFAAALSVENYDVILDLQDNFRSFILRHSVKGRVKKVYKKHTLRRRLMVLFKWFLRDSKSVSEKYMETAAGMIAPEKTGALKAPVSLRNKKIVNIHIHDGAQWKNKRWPYFGLLVKELLKIKKVRITITGVKDEVDNSDGLLYHKDRRVKNLTGKTDFSGLLKEISLSDLFIGNDTAAAHAAKLYGKPAVIFLGPTAQAFGFITGKDFTVMENSALMCRPCHLHGGNSCPIGSLDCMKTTGVPAVIDRIKKIIF